MTSLAQTLCSVVIPTHLRPEALRNCLVALLNQTLSPEFYEIIVVDDACSEALRVKVEALAAQHSLGGPSLRYLRPAEGSKGPAAARNAGWRAANGAIIAFTDDDAIPLPQWLAQGLAAMAPDNVAAAWGRVMVPLPEPPALPTDSERDAARLNQNEFVTANCFVRRAALDDAGGFDEHFTRPRREDTDLYFTLLEHHAKIIYAPAAKVLHPPHGTSPGASLHRPRHLYFDALLCKKHPRLYRQKISTGPPWHDYATVYCAVVALVAALSGYGDVAFIAGLGWAGLTAHFASRRLKGASKAWPHVADMIVTSIVIPFLAVFWRLYGALHFRVPFV
ncbi:MAG TPA: glycosyltransferase [Rhodocyclaceae bacterium]|nr:glycosyltransferase [Rhodocyclaceae bacterium]